MARWCDVVPLKDYSQAPDRAGVYEIGFWVEPNYFVPRYIGRARGRLDGVEGKKGTTIRTRLSKHYRQRGNKGVADAVRGRISMTALLDPDFLSEAGRQKMVIEKELYCRWMMTPVGSTRESNMLERYGISGTNQYIWNEKID